MRSILAEREKLYIKLLPWKHPNFRIDLSWARAYPYEQDVFSDKTFTVEIQFTKHADIPIPAKVEPVLPKGWIWLKKNGDSIPYIIPLLKDGSARLSILIPEQLSSTQYIIPFRITWNNRYLGQIRHAVINVM